LITGELVNGLLNEPENRIGRLRSAGRSNAEIIEELYLAALSRYPTTPEVDAAVRYVERSKDERAGLEDVAWGLVNAKEFLLRR
jgi:hypothetical protein